MFEKGDKVVYKNGATKAVYEVMYYLQSDPAWVCVRNVDTQRYRTEREDLLLKNPDQGEETELKRVTAVELHLFDKVYWGEDNYKTVFQMTILTKGMIQVKFLEDGKEKNYYDNEFVLVRDL